MNRLTVAVPVAAVLCLALLGACSVREERTVQQPTPAAATVVTPAPATGTVVYSPPPATSTTVYTR
ncbi:MAG: hypothetical protein U1E23_06780 [Reyranellaceae bacterium]